MGILYFSSNIEIPTYHTNQYFESHLNFCGLETVEAEGPDVALNALKIILSARYWVSIFFRGPTMTNLHISYRRIRICCRPTAFRGQTHV